MLVLFVFGRYARFIKRSLVILAATIGLHFLVLDRAARLLHLDVSKRPEKLAEVPKVTGVLPVRLIAQPAFSAPARAQALPVPAKKTVRVTAARRALHRQKYLLGSVEKPLVKPRPAISPLAQQLFHQPESLPIPSEMPLFTLSADPVATEEIENSALILDPFPADSKKVPFAVENTAQISEKSEKSENTENTENTSRQMTPISLPPAADLKYDVQASRQGQIFYGSGRINWQPENGQSKNSQPENRQYKITGEASALLFTFLNFKSVGAVDQNGLAPVLYTEKRFRKAETITHFQREPNIIRFSASDLSYPRTAGAQDRASIIWQLASLGRGNEKLFQPGAQIEIMVAGVRDAEGWQIKVMGQESIEIARQRVVAWHLIRSPQPGSYEQTLDLWFAPQQNWYPVKVRYSEVNGDYVELSLASLH